jgi:hypothetical protein
MAILDFGVGEYRRLNTFFTQAILDEQKKLNARMREMLEETLMISATYVYLLIERLHRFLLNLPLQNCRRAVVKGY